MEGRRERKKRQTRETIAKTALRLFAERGYDEVTVAEVAVAADVAVTTVFNYFKTKEDLFFGAFTPRTEVLAPRLRVRPPGVGPAEVVRELLLEALDHIAQGAGEEHHTRIQAALAMSPALQVQAMHRFRARRLESLDELAAALTAPEPPDTFAHLIANQMLALVEGAMCEAKHRSQAGELTSDSTRTMRAAIERACDALAKGLEDYGLRPTN